MFFFNLLILVNLTAGLLFTYILNRGIDDNPYLALALLALVVLSGAVLSWMFSRMQKRIAFEDIQNRLNPTTRSRGEPIHPLDAIRRHGG